MVFKNLLRRKGRTVLAVLGIGIGVASIVALGALADGLSAGYSSVLSGSDADLVISEPDAYDIIMSTIDESIGRDLQAMPEVDAVSALIQGMIQTDQSPYFFVFAYSEDSFVFERFNIIEGTDLYSREARAVSGRPMLIGTAAAEAFDKGVGDTMRLGGSMYRITGIYETGVAFEEGGAVLLIDDAQAQLGMQNQVSAYYIQLREHMTDPERVERLRERIGAHYPDISISTTEDLAGSTIMSQALQAAVWTIAALAILIGGISMMNSQLMSVIERTREIGILRAVGWRSWRVMWLILSESVMVGLLGGTLGILLGWGMLRAFSGALSLFGAPVDPQSTQIAQAFVVVVVLGVLGGVYPAYRASQLQPVEALRYEDGSGGGDTTRLPVGGMAARNLWRRKARTLMTLAVIGVTIGSITLLNAVLDGSEELVGDMAGGAEIIVREADVADTSLSFVDQSVGDSIERMAGVEGISGMLFTAIMSEDFGMFLIQGYDPRQPAIQDFTIIEGQSIRNNGQIMVGKQMADAQDIDVGDILELSKMRYRVAGIYGHSVSAYELGGVITLRDAQNFMGRPRKVTFFMIDLYDPRQADELVEVINANFPEAHAAVAAEFAEQLPDMQASQGMSDGIALLAILVGGVGVMNTMLMAVLERTREIGTLRALGWTRRAVIWLILREAGILGLAGGIAGILIAFGLYRLMSLIPTYGSILPVNWTVRAFAISIGSAIALGLFGGIYPALRATRMQPVEALRYE
ncbi:MAG: FtsX-like permease family protein [Anaerolineae bacterium]|nr:FtsX-like permease family protein [Anaerolineae bacterium]